MHTYVTFFNLSYITATPQSFLLLFHYSHSCTVVQFAPAYLVYRKRFVIITIAFVVPNERPSAIKLRAVCQALCSQHHTSQQHKCCKPLAGWNRLNLDVQLQADMNSCWAYMQTYSRIYSRNQLHRAWPNICICIYAINSSAVVHAWWANNLPVTHTPSIRYSDQHSNNAHVRGTSTLTIKHSFSTELLPTMHHS
jgi:hypothetical protein